MAELIMNQVIRSDCNNPSAASPQVKRNIGLSGLGFAGVVCDSRV